MFTRVLVSLPLVAGFLAIAATPAQAHAIIELNGTAAIAGQVSEMTLEVQHGCITKGSGTVQVLAYVGKPWGRVTPGPVAGWTSTTKRLDSGGQQVVWTTTGEPQPFSTPLYLPMRIRWPKAQGVYGMTVTQVCTDDVTTWSTPFGPATADAPSPPLTPLAQVKVLAKVASD